MADAKEIRRDIRVDRIGYVKELTDQYATPLRDRVKESMSEGERTGGDCFEALLAGATTTKTEIDKSALLKLFETGVIDRKEFLACFEPNGTGMKNTLAPKTFARIVKSETNPASPRLIIVRRKGVEVALVDAVASLAGDIMQRVKAA